MGYFYEQHKTMELVGFDVLVKVGAVLCPKSSFARKVEEIKRFKDVTLRVHVPIYYIPLKYLNSNYIKANVYTI